MREGMFDTINRNAAIQPRWTPQQYELFLKNQKQAEQTAERIRRRIADQAREPPPPKLALNFAASGLAARRKNKS